MEDYLSKDKCTGLPLSALRFLVSPVQLLSAAIWQTMEQKVLADYGMLEEYVSMVSDVVPDLLTIDQRAQLTLGLRARLILELCQSEATADLEVVQPHLDRMQMLIKAWVKEVGAANMETLHAEFEDLVKKLLKNSDEREQFFQTVFQEEFGPTYDEALRSLLWMFLSRLEKFLPLQTFQQVASMCGEVSSLLEESMDFVYQHDDLKTLLHYQKYLTQLDHNDGCLVGASIISALKLPKRNRTEMAKAQLQSNELNKSCTSNLDNETSTSLSTNKFNPAMIAEDQANRINVDDARITPQDSEPVAPLDENLGLIKSQGRDPACSLGQCSVELQVMDIPSFLHHQPVQPKRNWRTKKILLEDRKGRHAEDPTPKPAYRGKKSTSKGHSLNCRVSEPSTSGAIIQDARIASVSVNDSSACHETTSKSPNTVEVWSNHLDECAPVTPVNSYSDNDSLSSYSKNHPSVTRCKKASPNNQKSATSDIKASALKKTKVQCLICKEHIDTSLKSHMKTHFPTGNYTCPRCNSRFKFYSSLKLHVNRTCYEYSQQQLDPGRLAEFKKLYKCDKCKEAFRYKVALERHEKTHNALYCSVCRKVLRDAGTVARHKASHTPFQCNRCEESFTLFKPLLRHYQNVHKISKPFKCIFCSKISSRLRVLITHEWKHTGHLPFQCAQCGLRCHTDADLISHERVHTKEKPYLCAQCGKAFSRNSNLLRHLNFVHSESRNVKRYSCSECEKSFKEKGALKKHQRTKHLLEVFRHPCPYCGKMISASTMARHKLIHTGEKPFKCTEPECDRVFRSTSEVKRHVLLHHSTERPYKCEVCGKGFIKMCLLKAHAKIHSGEKPFVCIICNKAFLKLYSMQRHKQLIHAFETE